MWSLLLTSFIFIPVPIQLSLNLAQANVDYPVDKPCEHDQSESELVVKDIILRWTIFFTLAIIKLGIRADIPDLSNSMLLWFDHSTLKGSQYGNFFLFLTRYCNGQIETCQGCPVKKKLASNAAYGDARKFPRHVQRIRHSVALLSWHAVERTMLMLHIAPCCIYVDTVSVPHIASSISQRSARSTLTACCEWSPPVMSYLTRMHLSRRMYVNDAAVIVNNWLAY